LQAIACPRCGTPSSGGKFCKRCGTLLPQAGAAPPQQQQQQQQQQQAYRPPANPPRPPQSAAYAAPGRGQAVAGLSDALGMQIHAPLAGWEGLSKRWIVVPLAIFAFLANGLAMPTATSVVSIVVVSAIGAGLWWLRNNPLPPTAPDALKMLEPFRPYAPALILPVIFVALGGSLVSVALLVVAVGAIVRFRYALLDMLEPWWNFQPTIPAGIRKPLAFVVPMALGYYFGNRAGGREWTYTLISLSFGAAAAFLILFTPPDRLRKGRRPA
jgi:hypothetical protein